MSRTFAVDVERFARNTKASLSEACRAIKISLFTGVIMDTRVDTGRLRGNWQTETGSPATAEIERLDPQGTQATGDAAAKVTDFGVDYLTNNLPYAEVWDERDGMIDKNMARIERTVKEVASRVRR